MVNHTSYRKIFSIALITLEIIIVILYGLFVRTKVHSDHEQNISYTYFQDVNVMMLIGFGFLMTFVKTHSWSALAYTFFINAITVQLYLLLSGFWKNTFFGGWNNKIQITQKQFTASSYSVAAVLISFGAVLGRLGPLQLLIMALVEIIGYTLNQKIIYSKIQIYDVGGSTAIHTFGAYFGLTVSLVIARIPTFKCQTSYNSNLFAFLGTLFLWMFWPSFNAGYFAANPYQKSIIIGNTILALTGSCLSTFAVSGLCREKFNLEDILNATLAGGVIVGASAGLITNPAGSLALGILAGIISTLGYNFLTQKLQHSISLYDTCGVHNLHGIPGFLGGISSGIVIASYQTSPLTNSTQTQYLPFYNAMFHGRSFVQQGAIQVAGTFTSLAMGIAFGILAGFIIKKVSILDASQFYEDNIYFEVPPQSILQPTNQTFLTQSAIKPPKLLPRLNLRQISNNNDSKIEQDLSPTKLD